MLTNASKFLLMLELVSQQLTNLKILTNIKKVGKSSQLLTND